MSDFVKLPQFMTKKENLDESFKECLSYLPESGDSKSIAITVVNKGAERRYNLHFGKGKSEIDNSDKVKCDLELGLTLDTWFELATGKLSPLDALTRGKMAVKGDIHLGTSVLKTFAKLAKKDERYSLCD
jgi:putative sterol carrier protein